METREDSIPEEVVISEENTIASSSASSITSNVTNERISTSLAILFSKPQYDRNGDISLLIPVTITDEVQEFVTTCSSTSEQSRMISDDIEVLADDVKK